MFGIVPSNKVGRGKGHQEQVPTRSKYQGGNWVRVKLELYQDLAISKQIRKLELPVNYGYDENLVAKQGKIIGCSLTFFEIKLSLRKFATVNCWEAVRDSYNCR